MPRVPVDNLPGVMGQELPGVRLSPNAPEGAFGGGQQAYGEAHALASGSADLLMKAQQEADNKNVDDAIVKLSQLQNQLIYDPNNGLLFKKGENAAAAYQPTMDAFKRGATEIDGSLTTPQQKAKFRQHLVQTHVQLDGVTQRHIGTEVANQKLQSGAAAADSFANQAIQAAATDPVVTAQNIESQRGKLNELATLQGMDETQRAAFIASGVSRTNLSVLRSLDSAGQDMRATQYFNDNKDSFIGQDLIQAQREVEAGSYRGAAQRELQKIISPGVTDSEGGLRIYNDKPPTEREMYERVKAIEDPKLQDLVRNRLDEHLATQKRVAQDEYIKDVSDAEDVVQRTGSVDAIPTSLAERLRGKELRGLYALAKQLNTREPIQTNWKVYSNLKDMAANPATRNDFLKLLPMGFREDLSDTEFKEMVNLREGLIRGDGKAKKQADGYRTTAGIINTHLDNNGFKEKDAPQEREMIEQLMDEEIKYYRSKHDNEDPSNEDVKKMVSQMTQDAVVNPDAWFGGKEKGYLTTKKYLETADTAIPPDERKKIEAAMERNGITPTRRGIIEAWRAKQDPSTKWLPK